jgi:cytochrome b
MTTRILVWDFPTRVFHWLLAGSFAGAFVTADSETWRDLHVALGYLLLALIGFRIVWGLIGTRYARFKSFLFSPKAVRDYLVSLLTRHPKHYLGHNPAGSLAVFVLLGLGLLAGITGWATYNDTGGEWLEELHEGMADAMLIAVFVHIAGVVVSSLLHRENLVRAMLTGRKQGEPAQGIRYRHAWLGALLLAAVVAFWYWYPQTLATPDMRAQVAERQTHDGQRHAIR